MWCDCRCEAGLCFLALLPCYQLAFAGNTNTTTVHVETELV